MIRDAECGGVEGKERSMDSISVVLLLVVVVDHNALYSIGFHP